MTDNSLIYGTDDYEDVMLMHEEWSYRKKFRSGRMSKSKKIGNKEFFEYRTQYDDNAEALELKNKVEYNCPDDVTEHYPMIEFDEATYIVDKEEEKE